jgi:hypothetical protein
MGFSLFAARTILKNSITFSFLLLSWKSATLFPLSA